MTLTDMYIIGQIVPISDEVFFDIEKAVNYSLPSDYKEFMRQYGYGNLNGLLLFETPDEGFVKNNFGDYLDLWEWDKPLQDKALQSVMVAKTIDGDVIVAIHDEKSPYLLLPRHSEYPKLFACFQEVIEWYVQEYQLKKLYFDSHYQRDYRYFLIEGEFLDLKLEKIALIYKKFKKNYAVDAFFGVEDYQPKCVLQAIGGWVYFNLDTGEIRMKFQKIYHQKAKELIEFFEEEIK